MPFIIFIPGSNPATAAVSDAGSGTVLGSTIDSVLSVAADPTSLCASSTLDAAAMLESTVEASSNALDNSLGCIARGAATIGGVDGVELLLLLLEKEKLKTEGFSVVLRMLAKFVGTFDSIDRSDVKVDGEGASGVTEDDEEGGGGVAEGGVADFRSGKLSVHPAVAFLNMDQLALATPEVSFVVAVVVGLVASSMSL